MKNCGLTPLVCDICFFPPHLPLISVKLHYSYTLDMNANQLHWRTEEDVQVSAKITAIISAGHLVLSPSLVATTWALVLCVMAHAYTLKNGA